MFEVASSDGRITLRATRAVCRVVQRDLAAEGIAASVRPVSLLTEENHDRSDQPDYARPR